MNGLESPFRLRRSLLVLLAGSFIAGITGCHRGDPNKLWEIVHEECVPDQQQHGKAVPCAVVDLGAGEDAGFALLKDIHGDYQYLLIPTTRVTGIESPVLLGDAGARYTAAAWDGRRLLQDALHRELPRSRISLAINSRYGRSQEQLHIHIDCLKAEVQAALHQHQSEIVQHWTDLDFPLAGHHYRARRIAASEIAGMNPFRLLADSSSDVAAEMGRHTLVIVGADFEDGSAGFILLDDRASLWQLDQGHGEELQDELCR